MQAVQDSEEGEQGDRRDLLTWNEKVSDMAFLVLLGGGECEEKNKEKRSEKGGEGLYRTARSTFATVSLCVVELTRSSFTNDHTEAKPITDTSLANRIFVALAGFKGRAVIPKPNNASTIQPVWRRR